MGAGKRQVLQTQPGWEVVPEANDASHQTAATKPDVAVLNCMLPLIDGVEATRQIRARTPEPDVLLFTLHEDERLIKRLLREGARGYV